MRPGKIHDLIDRSRGVAAPAILVDRLMVTIRMLDPAHLPTVKIQKMESYVENSLAFIQVEVNSADCGRILLPAKVFGD
jgi:hypothetical protein